MIDVHEFMSSFSQPVILKDVVATFVDERVIGNDLGFWDLLVNEFGDLPQGVRPDAPWIVAKRKRVTPKSGLLRASSTTSEATLVRA